MAVFFDTGGGDIYAGPDKKSVLDAIREDIGDEDFNEIEDEIYEVPGSMKIQCTDENDEPIDEQTTLASAYLCADCDAVGSCATRCPSCASCALLSLGAILNRNTRWSLEQMRPARQTQV